MRPTLQTVEGAGARGTAARAARLPRRARAERRAIEAPPNFPVAAAALTDAVMDALAEGLLVFDTEGRLLGCNRAAEEILGVVADDLIGVPAGDTSWEAVRRDGTVVPSDELPSRRTIATGESVEREVYGMPAPDGRRQWLAISSRGLFVPGAPRPYAVVVSLVDVTDHLDAQDRLQEREADLAAAQRIAGLGSWSWDPETNVVEVSPGLCQLVGYDTDEVHFDLPWLLNLILPTDQDGPETRRELEALNSDGHLETELELQHADGEMRMFQVRAEPEDNGDGGATGRLRGTVLDVTRLRSTEFELREREAELGALLDGSPDPIMRIDRELRLVAANAEALRLLERPLPDALGQKLTDVGGSTLGGQLWEAHAHQVFETGRPAVLEIEIGTAEGRRWHEIRFAPQLATDGSVPYVVTIGRDVTERRQAAAFLAHEVLHDPLTGLANRRGLLDAVGRVIVRRDTRPFALLILDLDHFKRVNDTLGHAAGDTLLSTLARRLRGALRPEDLLARLGGDEFAVLLDVVDAGEAARVAQRLRAALADPVDVRGHVVTTSASVGVVLAAPGTALPEELLARADAAMYLAKSRGRGRTEFFDDALRVSVETRLADEESLRRAVAQGDLVVHYQPEVDLLTGELIAVEALVRWDRGRHGLVSASAFVGVAEDTGIIGELGTQVLREACRQAGRWRATARAVPVRVNISARQLGHPGLLATVLEAISAGDARPEDLTIEVADGNLSIASETGDENLARLRSAGVELVVDNFGVGASSLSRIVRLAPALLKLDRSLVAGALADAAGRSLVEGVLALASRLGVPVTAEGVETVEQAELLRLFGCSGAQGHLFAAPGPASDLDRMLLRR